MRTRLCTHQCTHSANARHSLTYRQNRTHMHHLSSPSIVGVNCVMGTASRAGAIRCRVALEVKKNLCSSNSTAPREDYGEQRAMKRWHGDDLPMSLARCRYSMDKREKRCAAAERLLASGEFRRGPSRICRAADFRMQLQATSYRIGE